MIKLIVSDVDGTLVEDGSSRLDPRIYQAILALREKGVQFAAASGRAYSSLEKAFEPIREKIFYIANNGAYIGCYGRSLFTYPIERSLMEEIVTDIRKHPDLQVMCAGENGDYIESNDPELYTWLTEGYKFRITRVNSILELPEPCIKLSIYKPQGVEAATADLVEKYGSRLQMACAGDMWMDCMAPGINKGQAVKLLQESLDIKPEETMVFGDQLNDIEMLKQGYYSFAVANAREEVRQAARFQTDSNKNLGALKILNYLL